MGEIIGPYGPIIFLALFLVPQAAVGKASVVYKCSSKPVWHTDVPKEIASISLVETLLLLGSIF